MAVNVGNQPRAIPEGADHLFTFNPNPSIVTWERLEAQRVAKLNLSNKYSRHFNVLRLSKEKPISYTDSGRSTFELSGSRGGITRAVQEVRTSQAPERKKTGMKVTKANSIAPFATSGKPTCGFFFSDGTDNKKKKFGIPPSDLVKWRNFNAH